MWSPARYRTTVRDAKDRSLKIQSIENKVTPWQTDGQSPFRALFKLLLVRRNAVGAEAIVAAAVQLFGRRLAIDSHRHELWAP
jgi:hypothetical protein